jgi:hydrogenase nickel incorporation protein HypA/HybF
MHELSIATGIIEIVLEEASKASASKVTEVELEIGTMAGVEKEALLFAWDLVADGTIAHKSSLLIREVRATAECLDCQSIFPLEDPLSVCPQCHSLRYKSLSGRELRIRSIIAD